MFSYYTNQIGNKKGTDQTVQKRRLVCVYDFVVHMQHVQAFSLCDPNDELMTYFILVGSSILQSFKYKVCIMHLTIKGSDNFHRGFNSLPTSVVC